MTDKKAPEKCAETTKDSGHRKTFASGSQRDAPEGKGRYDLISPLALRRLALVLERGAAKYEARNWEKGQPLSQYMNSALRHLCQYIGGMRDEDHLGQALWNVHAALHTEEAIDRGILPAELADLPDYTEGFRPIPTGEEEPRIPNRPPFEFTADELRAAVKAQRESLFNYAPRDGAEVFCNRCRTATPVHAAVNSGGEWWCWKCQPPTP